MPKELNKSTKGDGLGHFGSEVSPRLAGDPNLGSGFCQVRTAGAWTQRPLALISDVNLLSTLLAQQDKSLLRLNYSFFQTEQLPALNFNAAAQSRPKLQTGGCQCLRLPLGILSSSSPPSSSCSC